MIYTLYFLYFLLWLEQISPWSIKVLVWTLWLFHFVLIYFCLILNYSLNIWSLIQNFFIQIIYYFRLWHNLACFLTKLSKFWHICIMIYVLNNLCIIYHTQVFFIVTISLILFYLDKMRLALRFAIKILIKLLGIYYMLNFDLIIESSLLTQLTHPVLIIFVLLI